jgi:hypothetical protein
MDAHQFLRIAGGALTLLLFIPMIVGVRRDGGAGQSFATWILWAALDLVLFGSLVAQHGNYFMALGFAIGDAALAAVLLAKGRVVWSWFENVILFLVVASLMVWGCGGSKMATIASAVGCLIAGLPGLVTLWRNPDRKLGNIWAGYVLANALSFFGGTAMTVEERFAPGAFTVFSILMFAASRRKIHRNQIVTCEVGEAD